MQTTTLSAFLDGRERLRGTLAVSLALHTLLFLTALSYEAMGLRFGRGGGKSWGAGGATRIGAVASLPGVPLPAPMLATPSTLATQSPGLYQTEERAEPAKPAVEEEIPKFKEAIPQEKPIRVAKRLQKEPLVAPEHAIPFGLGGKPALTHMQFVNAAGSGGLGFGEGGFGDRYGWYVAAVRNRISANWLLAMISPSIVTAPRVYVNFDILRGGMIGKVEIVQSSGIPEVDRSALRAVLASNPLAPLPPDYPGNTVSVEFYFDFRRQ